MGRDGKGPPDWEIQYRGDKIGVEVTLLHDTEGWGRTKEKAFGKEIWRLMREVSQEGGQKWHVLCEYDLKAMVRDAVLCHFDDSMPRPKLICLRFVHDDILLV